MRRQLLFMVMFFFSLGVFAQKTVSGKVTSKEDGSALPGVTVQVKGTNQGTQTDFDGNYSIQVGDGAVLIFSFVGMTTQEVAVGNQSTVNLTMKNDDKVLSEVVITAAGIERDKRSLGFSVQEVKGDNLAQRGAPNVLTALQGKVAGVNIVSGSGGAGASTNINIRGITSFTGSNQPLFVVDGIPVSNNLDQTNNTLFDSQPSNRAVDINPDNIESVTVLKGAAAAALYGSRAAAGVIMITTKSGKNAVKKTEITYNGSYNVQQVYGLPVLQNEYGQGSLNVFNNASSFSWGPKFGTPGFENVTTVQGESVPYKAFPNNVRGFFRDGIMYSNSVNIATGNEKSNFNLSLSDMNQQGIVPNTNFGRSNIQVVAGSTLSNGLKAQGNFNYIRTVNTGTPQGNGGSALGQITRIPRSYDLMGRPYKDDAGRSIYYNLAQNHPLWSTENELFNSTVDRIMGNTQLVYDVGNWLNITWRGGVDTYTDRRKVIAAIGAARAPKGQIIEDIFMRTEFNSDLIITAKKENIIEGLNASLMVGHNVNQRSSSSNSVVADELTIPNYYNANNAAVFTNSGESNTMRRLVGYYSQLSLAYKNYLYVDFTGRIDQSSTLPAANRTFFYPSVSGTFVFTELLKIDPAYLTYGKLKANWAKVGRDADPYLLQSVFVASSFGNNVASINFPLNNIPGFQPSTRIGSDLLTPEFTSDYEVGVNLGFWRNRISVDFTYFDRQSINQIMNVAIPTSTGFSTRTTNVGKMTNKGVELLLNVTPVKTNDFMWDISLNYTRIRNEVVEITEGIDAFTIPGNSFIGIAPSIKKGQPYGVILGSQRTRNANGDWLVNGNTGAYVPATANQVVANPQPDWFAGVTNNFSYKGINLSVLFDFRQGGQIYSFGMADLVGNGSLKITGADRDQPRILKGVIDNGDGTFRPNNIQLSPQVYWGSLGGLASEAAVFDASVYRLREIALSYSLPKKLIEKTPFGELSISLSGRNLWFYAAGFPGDPEINKQGAGNIQGMDLNGAPNTRNYGFNIKFTL